MYLVNLGKNLMKKFVKKEYNFLFFEHTNYIKKKRRVSMERDQKINCTVSSCKYNEKGKQECSLKQIIVTPVENCDTKQPDESMCSSYKNN